MRRNLYRDGGNSSSPRSQSSSSLLLLLLIFIALLFSIDPSAAADVDDDRRRSAALAVSLDSHSRFTAVRAQNVVSVGKETLADERDRALLAVEMLIMPMAVFKGNVLRSSKTGDGLGALEALFGEKLSEAVCAVGLFLLGGEALSRQRLLTVSAREAVAVVRIVLVRHTTRRNHFFALGALGREELLIASDAVVVFVFRDEALRPQSLLAVVASEAILVPLLAFVLHLLGAWSEDFVASVASGGEFVGVAVAAVDLLLFAAERLVDEAVAADAADEAPLVPVLLFVREILGVCSYGFGAFFAGI